ncbi:MAG: adenylate cyclase [Thermodesulfobacteriota bacterium]|nr:adenylate cyclase [Thermodesulfobacteriota bacterium]
MTAGLRSSIAIKLALLVMGGSVAVFSLILAYSYTSSRQIILNQAKDNALNLALSMSRRIEQDFRAVAKLPMSLAGVLENSDLDEKALLGLIRRMVQDNSEIYGMTVAFQPYTFKKDLRSYAPYYYKSSKGIEFTDLGASDYNYFQQDWYHIPLELKAPSLSEPYFDQGAGNVLMVTYSYPFFERSEDGKRLTLRGIITADIELHWLTKLVATINESRKGFSFVVTGNGVFVSHPNFDYVMKESLFSLAESRGNSRLREIGKEILKFNKGFIDIGTSLDSQDSYLAYSKILSTGWRFGAVFPKSELFWEVQSLHHTTFLLSLVGFGLLALMSILVARSISKPLKEMAKATTLIGHGDLNISLKAVNRTDEVGMLAKSFTDMANGLKERDFIRDAFGRYVTQEVVNRLLDTHDGLKLGGEIREISMMMSDIRGFTALTANMKPEAIITLLNRYLGKMVEILLDHRGIIDEIIGDGILAFFGAPEPLEDHPEAAVACALKMQQAMNELNARNVKDGLPRLEMGIAVNTGRPVVGNIGSDQRVKYGAVGPDVNFTGRVESYTVGGQVLITQSTYDRLANILEVRKTLQVEMKGFSGAVTLYDVSGIKGKYAVTLKDEEENLRTLEKPLPVTCYRLEEKTVSFEGTAAVLTAVSDREAEFEFETAIKQWENLRFALHGPGGETSEAIVYAKVVSAEKKDQMYLILVHFTSVSPQALDILRKSV